MLKDKNETIVSWDIDVGRGPVRLFDSRLLGLVIFFVVERGLRTLILHFRCYMIYHSRNSRL